MVADCVTESRCKDSCPNSALVIVNSIPDREFPCQCGIQSQVCPIVMNITTAHSVWEEGFPTFHIILSELCTLTEGERREICYNFVWFA